jgi:hypothetical protein
MFESLLATTYGSPPPSIVLVWCAVLRSKEQFSRKVFAKVTIRLRCQQDRGNILISKTFDEK